MYKRDSYTSCMSKGPKNYTTLPLRIMTLRKRLIRSLSWRPQIVPNANSRTNALRCRAVCFRRGYLLIDSLRLSCAIQLRRLGLLRFEAATPVTPMRAECPSARPSSAFRLSKSFRGACPIACTPTAHALGVQVPLMASAIGPLGSGVVIDRFMATLIALASFCGSLESMARLLIDRAPPDSFPINIRTIQNLPTSLSIRSKLLDNPQHRDAEGDQPRHQTNE